MRSDYRMPLTPRRRLACGLTLGLLAAASLGGVLLLSGAGASPPRALAAPRAERAPQPAAAASAARSAAPAVGVSSSSSSSHRSAAPAVRAAASAATVATAPPLRLAGRLPAWRAPGAPLTVEGSTAPRARVALLVAGRRVATASAGPKGRFVVTGRLPQRVGRAAVAVASGGRRLAAGSVRIRPIALAAVGDVTFGDGVGWRIARTSTRYPWLRVARVLGTADIATANLEGAVSERGTAVPGKLFHFRGPALSVRAAVRFAGIDVFTLANNHSRDFGAIGLLDTVKAVRTAGGHVVGGGADLVAARTPVILQRGGLRVAFLGYNDVPPWSFTARRGYPGTAPAVPADIARDVRVTRARADLVVVWFHWGAELQPEQNGRQEELARVATEAGATLVLGAHPHVLLPVEQPAPGVLVAWSLGNFVFSPRSEQTARTAVLHVQLGSRGVLGHRLQPARISAEQPRFTAAG